MSHTRPSRHQPGASLAGRSQGADGVEPAVAGGPPAWFAAALQQEPEALRVDVDGCAVNGLAWGRRDRRPLVLIHGGAAHANWWSPVAPSLARDHRVVAVDLSGHGDSGHRAVYRAEQWAEEVLAVAEHAGGVGPPTVVGHSMGGFVAIVAAARHGASLDGTLLLDTPVRRVDRESIEGRKDRMFRAPKVYEDRETAVEHFHLFPPQPCDNPWMVGHIARTSLRRVDGGWTWKFDPGVFVNREGLVLSSHFAEPLGRVEGRVAVLNGELSDVLDAEVRDHMVERLAASPAAAHGIPVIGVPHAHHHMMLDQPLGVVAAVRSVLAAWRPTVAPTGESVAGAR